MKTYVTSDLHLGHSGIIKYCNRPFNNVQEMDDFIVSEWNSIVDKNDKVYILGDVTFYKDEKATNLVSSLNGNKSLVTGNHDKRNLKYKPFKSCFEQVHNYYEFYYNNNVICMFHFPILEWHGAHKGYVHLHGHMHGKSTGLEKFKIKDVGYDATKKVVLNIDDILEELKTKENKPYGH